MPNFFNINRDLVAAAGERSCDPLAQEPASSKALEPLITAMTEPEKNAFLLRLFDGDPHLGAELRALVRHRLQSETNTQNIQARTVSDLRIRAEAIRDARERILAEKAATERKRCEKTAERSRRARLEAIARRGEDVWREIETEIERRNAAGYDKAVSLLLDLMTISSERGVLEGFTQRLQDIRRRHAQKARLIERLAKLGC